MDFSKSSRKSWHSLWCAIPLLFFVFVMASRAARENDAASMQQTSFGTITDCHPERGGYYCNYVFPIDGEPHKGTDRANSYLPFGTTVVVYYDSQDPAMSALDDFSGKSRGDWNMVYVLLLVIAGLVTFIVYSKTTNREASKQRLI